ncbi:hypothetical protein DPMN_184835 [Dreissena polymorpha]|uniref:Innexin n=1 Tax=Dreissena polymorpha TaxID=45954 RepID=A0A9D4DKS0_DREPO|nr:hypothetical protein DPMN_184835 [Dreissena polymorpha]
MSWALDGFGTIRKFFNPTADDWIDKLNHKYTTVLVLMFATIVSTSQFVGDPIHCWSPAEFSGAWNKYTSAYCWIKNTYFIPMTNTLPRDLNVRSNAEITYYQWVPLILVFQAVMFKFPNFLWVFLTPRSGFNMVKVSTLAHKAYYEDPKKRQEAIANIAKFMDIWIRSHFYYKQNVFTRTKARISRVLCIVCNKKEGKYISALYFSVKILYVINVISQFYILNAFLGMDYTSYGYAVLNGLSSVNTWPESPRFPRITLCDFTIRQLQNVQRYTVQCVLPINLFNEKVFIFLWFWLFMVAVLSCINLFQWFVNHVARRNNYMFVKKYLKNMDRVRTADDKKLCRKFSDYYLRDDGCFVLKIIGMNTSDLVVMDLIEQLWGLYVKNTSRRVHFNDDEEHVADTTDGKSASHASPV